MSKEVKSNAEFLLNNSKEYEKRAEKNRKIFEDANLAKILNQIVIQELFNKHMFMDWGENNLSLKLKVPFDRASKPFSLSEDELQRAESESLTVFEAFLSTNNEIIIANDWYGKSELEGGDGRKEILDYIHQNTNGILKEENPDCTRKTIDTEIIEDNKGSAKNKSRRFNLFKTLSD